MVAIASGGCTKGAGVGAARCYKWCVQGQEAEDDVSAGVCSPCEYFNTVSVFTM